MDLTKQSRKQTKLIYKLNITNQTFLTAPVLVKTKEWQHPQVAKQNKIMDWQISEEFSFLTDSRRTAGHSKI